MRLSVNHALPLAALILLGGYVATATAKPDSRPPAPVSGPAADYPMVIGEPFTIGSVQYTPVDQLNYDAVGYAAIGDESTMGVTGAHKTLPLPSYVEVTSLDSGKTILVRLERRGPMANDTLLELSPEAAAQLGVAPGSRSAIRMRRVNPPEVERAELRQDRPVPARMATPEALLKVLRRKLAEQSPGAPVSSTPPPMPTSAPTDAPKPIASAPVKTAVPGKPPVPGTVKTLPAPVATPKPEPKPAPPAAKAPASAPAPSPTPPKPSAAPAAKGSYVVQVAALSAKDRADKLAKQLGGHVAKPGKLWLVRLGPFPGSGEAGPALAKAKSAGYSDARILRAD